MPLRHAIGLEKLMWGSDYPHDEGTFPYSREALRNAFAGLPHEEIAAILGGNAARVYGFDLAALDAVAARVGPTRGGDRRAAEGAAGRRHLADVRGRQRDPGVVTQRVRRSLPDRARA